jgi:hypothetical protein
MLDDARIDSIVEHGKGRGFGMAPLQSLPLLQNPLVHFRP